VKTIIHNQRPRTGVRGRWSFPTEGPSGALIAA
jgi:hypothetical protein